MNDEPKEVTLFGRFLLKFFPGLVKRMKLQIRAYKKMQLFKRKKAMFGLSLSDADKRQMERNIERYKRFYNEHRFFWDSKA